LAPGDLAGDVFIIGVTRSCEGEAKEEAAPGALPRMKPVDSFPIYVQADFGGCSYQVSRSRPFVVMVMAEKMGVGIKDFVR
jgi:hypothetical protein